MSLELIVSLAKYFSLVLANHFSLLFLGEEEKMNVNNHTYTATSY